MNLINVRFGNQSIAMLCLCSFLFAATARPDGKNAGAEQDDPILASAMQPWTGDLDAMTKRGMIRVAIPYGLTTYFLDGADQKGLTYDRVIEFDKFLKQKLGTAASRINVVIIPTNRERLLPMVVEGKADIAAANLTITDERRKVIDFSVPIRTDVRELLVTGKAAPDVKSAEDMLASRVYVRRSSSYYEHLVRLNEKREAQGKKPFPFELVDDNLNAEDLLEMVSTGVIPATIVDEPVADFFVEVFDNIHVRDDMVLAEQQHIAWGMRRDSPQLKALLDDYISKVSRKGSMVGNVLLARYLKNTTWIKNVLAPEDRALFESNVAFFRKYAAQYDFDWILVGAQGYQESGLIQSKRSAVGAIGIMQVMPTTATDPNVGIPDISDAENNIHAGVKYLRFLRNRYFSDPAISPLNQTLFTFAAYNAGPGNVARARKRAAEMGLDRNVWLDNVEIAAGKVISREPVVYVRNIYKYYVAYRMIAEQPKQPPG